MRRIIDPQTSHKSGSHSTVQKLHASRPDFGSSPKSKPVPGASGPRNYSKKSEKGGSHK